MDAAILDLGHSQYLTAIGMDDIERDDDGFILLRPTAARVDEKVESLTTNIDALEVKLQALRKSKAEAEAYRETDAYKEDKKKAKGKGKKKKARERETLLNMVFNNADQVAAAEIDAEVHDPKKKGGGKKKVSDTTLDTTYGKRFSTVVSMLYDSIQDFDKIAIEIREELDSAQGRTKGMYRSSQMANLISATSKKFDAVKELGTIAKTVSDLEYKEKKDKKAEEGTDTSKAISSLAAKYLRGNYDSDGGKKGKKKDKDKEKAKGNFAKSAKSMGYDPDEDEDADIKRDPQKKARDQELAKEFAKALEGRADELSFTSYERHLDMEGKYHFVITCDPLDPEHTWNFMAVDQKGREIEGFKKDYKDLMPKKKDARIRFEVAKMKAVDLNSSKVYKLLFVK